MQIIFLFFLVLISAVAELFTIGSLIPFIDLMIDPSKFINYAFLGSIYEYTNSFQDINININLFITILFASLVFISLMIQLILTFSTVKIVHGISHDLSVDVFRVIINKPYSFHLKTNTSNTISNFDRVAQTGVAVQLILQSITSILIALFIIGMLTYINFFITLSGGLIFSSFYLIVFFLTRRKLYKNSKKLSESVEQRIKSIQESLGSIKETILSNLYNIYTFRFSNVNFKMFNVLASNSIISAIPKHIIMLIAMISLTVLIYIISLTEDGLVSNLPTLAALILGAQKLLPHTQNGYNGWSKAQGSNKAISEIINILNQSKKNYFEKKNRKIMPLEVKNHINFESISFKYDTSEDFIFRNISFKIRKNNLIGITGKTGSGKSTLIDILMGLLEVNSGAIKIDSIKITKNNIKNWQKNIAHVPQSVYLADLSIAENIALGAEYKNIDKKLMYKCAEIAEIKNFILSKKKGFKTIVGERGASLSGGQRQRIGIARALYLDSQLMVFDEATNALDEKTEIKIYKNLKKFLKNKTVIVISHRKNLSKIFDDIYNVKDKKIFKTK